MGRHSSPPPDPQEQAKKAALAAQASELIESAGWESVALKQARFIIRQNHKLLMRRDATEQDAQAARGAIDSMITWLQVVYTTAGLPIPEDLKHYFD